MNISEPTYRLLSYLAQGTSEVAQRARIMRAVCNQHDQKAVDREDFRSIIQRNIAELEQWPPSSELTVLITALRRLQ